MAPRARPQLADAHHSGMRDYARDHGDVLGHFANIHKLVPDPERRGTYIWQPELERLLAAHSEALGLRVLRGHEVVVEELRDARRFGDHARQADTYRRGRVLLAGDAAHVHSPSGGQGLNLGLLDAANLGWKLAAAVRGDAPDGLLGSYQRERRPAGEAVLRNTRAQSALLAPGPHVDALREILAELLDIPEANRYVTGLLSGVHQRYELPYPAPEPVGTHCPDLELVDDAGSRSRLHEHARSGRGLLLLTPRTRELEALAAGRVDVVPVTNSEPLLIRPDGVVAWAGATAMRSPPRWTRGSAAGLRSPRRRTDEFLPRRRSKARTSRHPR